jgi:hypothetical protein
MSNASSTSGCGNAPASRRSVGLRALNDIPAAGMTRLDPSANAI